jgi:hypothetical protein
MNPHFRTAFLRPDGSVVVSVLFQDVMGFNTRNDVYVLSSQAEWDQKFASKAPLMIALPGNGLVATDYPSKLDLLAPDGSVSKVIDLTALVGEYASVRPTVLTPENKIIYAFGNSGLGRLNLDGTPDPTFDTAAAGAALSGTTFVAPDFPLPSLVLCQNGGSLLTATVSAGTVITRLDPDGHLDPSFIRAQVNGYVSSMALDPKGRLLIAGGFTTVDGYNRLHLARLRLVAEPTTLRLLRPRQEANCFTVSVQSLDGHRYVLESKSALGASEWTAVASASGNQGMLSLGDTNRVSGQQFYRVRME